MQGIAVASFGVKIDGIEAFENESGKLVFTGNVTVRVAEEDRDECVVSGKFFGEFNDIHDAEDDKVDFLSTDAFSENEELITKIHEASGRGEIIWGDILGGFENQARVAREFIKTYEHLVEALGEQRVERKGLLEYRVRLSHSTWQLFNLPLCLGT